MAKIQENIIEVKPQNALYETLGIMRELEKQSLNDRDFNQFCLKTFLQKMQPLKFSDFIESLHTWVKTNIQYTDDLYDETLISPRILFHTRKGDCDDFALFIKTVLSFFNIKSYYILFAKQEDEYTHIANVVPLKNSFLFVDATNQEFNSFPYSRYNYFKIVR